MVPHFWMCLSEVAAVALQSSIVMKFMQNISWDVWYAWCMWAGNHHSMLQRLLFLLWLLNINVCYNILLEMFFFFRLIPETLLWLQHHVLAYLENNDALVSIVSYDSNIYDMQYIVLNVLYRRVVNCWCFTWKDSPDLNCIHYTIYFTIVE